MEKIIAIVETGVGYNIETDKQVIELNILGSQSCCEQFGYFMSEDNLTEFVGSDFLNIEITDTLLNSKKLDEVNGYEGDTMFVNIETSNGLLQFVAYNYHNGYYGHEAQVISTQLNHSTYL